MRTRPRPETPNLLKRFSSWECSRSSHSRASGSAKTVVASSNETPCFFRFLAAFRTSQANTIYVYTIINVVYQGADDLEKAGVRHSLWKLVPRLPLTWIATGSIKISDASRRYGARLRVRSIRASE